MNSGLDNTEFLTTKEVAELLRIKERKLYDLVGAQEIPCVKATGKLLFPKAELMHWIRTGEFLPDGKRNARLNVLAGSHDPLLEWAIRESACGLAMQFDGSLSGLDVFEKNGAVATGLHILNANNNTAWNTHAVQTRFATGNVVLVHWATRQQGLIVPKGNPKKIRSVADLHSLKIATRQAGAGGMILFEHLLHTHGLDLAKLNVSETCRTENDTIAAVASGKADVAPGLQALATQFGLGFVPTQLENFDLMVCRKAWFDSPFQKLIQFSASNEFKKKAQQFEGYNTTALGTVVWNS
jgi:putative molybdopterin biosynthesis protein